VYPDSLRAHFLIAGVQKGGTTALADYLRQHPALFMPAAKELHFFDDESLNWQQPQDHYGSYHAQFSDAPAGSLWGEATPIYSYWWPAMARIWAYNPEMRLILCLRNPVERAYSHWAMETGRSWDTLPFPEAITSEAERCRAALPQQHRVFSYTSRGFYSEQLRRLWSFFPREQTLILRQEELLKDPGDTLSRVHRFLGVDPLIPAQTLKANRGNYANPMDPALRNHLQQLFNPEITQLEQLLNWDLSQWRGEIPAVHSTNHPAQRLGMLQGQCSVPDDFDRIQTEELADSFEGQNQPTTRSPSGPPI
jgi:hypothetical protein